MMTTAKTLGVQNPDRPRNQDRARAVKQRIERAVGNCSALARVADDFRIDVAALAATPEEMADWVEVFAEARMALARLEQRIEEVR